MFRYLGVNQVRNIDSLYSGENIEINRNLNNEKKEGAVSENQTDVKSTDEGKDSKSTEAGSSDQRRSQSSEKHSSHSDRHSHKRDDHHKSSSSLSHHHHYHHKSSSSRQQQTHRYQRQLQLDKFNRFRRSVSVEPTAYRSQHKSFIQKPPSGPGYGGHKEWGVQGQRKKRGDREGGWVGHPRGGGRGKRGGYQGRRGNRRRQNRRNMMDHHDDAMDLEMPPPPNQHFRHNMRNNKGFNKPNFNPRPPLLPLPLPPPPSSMMMLPPPPPPPLFDMPPPPLVPAHQHRDTSPVSTLPPPGSSSSEAIQKEKFEHNRMLAEKRDEHSVKEKSLMQDLHMLQSQRAKLLKQHDPHNNKIVKENEKLQDEIRKKIEATRSAIQMLTDIIGDHLKHSTPQISRRAPPSPVHESEDDSSDSRDSDDSSQSESESHSSQESTDTDQHASAGGGVFKTPAQPGRGQRYKISRNRNIFVRRRDITTRDRRKIDTTSFIQTAGQAVLKSQQQETLQEKSQKMEMKLHHCEDTDNEDIFPLVSSVTSTSSTGASGGSSTVPSSKTMEEDIEEIFNLRRTLGQRFEEESGGEDERKESGGRRDEEVQPPPRRKSPTTIIEEIILDGNDDLSGVLTKPSERDRLRCRANIQITLKKKDRRSRGEEKKKGEEEEREEENRQEKDGGKKDLSAAHESSVSSDKLEVFWCQSCDLEFATDVDYLNHLHSTAHAQNSKPEQPWLGEQPALVAPGTPPPQHKHRVCSGSQMLIPVAAWYCKLCRECFVDIRAAASHLQCPLHWSKLENYTNENPLWEITLLRARTEASSVKPNNQDKKDLFSATFKPVTEEAVAPDATIEPNSPSSKSCDIESSNPVEESKPARTSMSEMFAEETSENGDKNKLWVPNRKAFDEISKQQQTAELTDKSGKKKPSFIGKMPTGKGRIKIKMGKSSSDRSAGGNNETRSEIDTNLAASVGSILSQLTSIYRVEQEHEEAERERDILYAEREMALREAMKRKQESRGSSRDGSGDSSRDNSVQGRDSQRQGDSSDERKSENSDGLESEGGIQKAISRSSRSRSSSRSSSASSTSRVSRSQSSRDNSMHSRNNSTEVRIISPSLQNISHENSQVASEPAEYVDLEFDFDSSQEDHPGLHPAEQEVCVSSDDELDVDDKLVEDSDEAEEVRQDANFSTASKASSVLEHQNDSNVSSRLDIDFFSRSHDETGNEEQHVGEQKFTNVSGFFEANQHRNHIDTFLSTVGVDSSRLSLEEEGSGLSERVESIMKRQERVERGLSETSSSQEEEGRLGSRDVREDGDYANKDHSVEYMSGSDTSETQTRPLSAHMHNSRTLDTQTSEEKPEHDEDDENIQNSIGFQGAIFFNRKGDQRPVQLPFLSEESPGDIFQDCQQLKSKLDKVKERIRADNKRYSSFQDAFRDHRERCAIQLREDNMKKQDEGSFEAPGFNEVRDYEEQEDVPPEADAVLQENVGLAENRVDIFHQHRDTETPVGAMFTRNRSKRVSLTEHQRGCDEESCHSFDTGNSRRKKVNKYLEEEEKMKSLLEEGARLRAIEKEHLQTLSILKEEFERKQLEKAEKLSEIVKERNVRRNRLRVLEEQKLITEGQKMKPYDEDEEDQKLQEEDQRLQEEILKQRQLLEEEKVIRQHTKEEVQAKQYEEPSAARQSLVSEAAPAPSQPKRPRRLGNLNSLLNRFRFETKISEVDCSEEIDDMIDEIYKAKNHSSSNLGFFTSYPTRSDFVNFALRISSSQTSVRHVNTAMRDINPETHFKPIGHRGIMKEFPYEEMAKEDDPLREHSLYPLTYSHHDGLVSPLERSQRSDVSPDQELSELNPPKLPHSAVIQRQSLTQQGKSIVKKRKKKTEEKSEKRQKGEVTRPWSRQSVLSELSVAESDFRPPSCDEIERVRSLQSRLSGQVEARGAFLSNSFRTSTPSSTLSSTLSQGRVKPSLFEPIEEDTPKLLEDTERYLQSAVRYQDESLQRSRLAQKSQPVNVGKEHKVSRPSKSKDISENPPMKVRKRRLKAEVLPKNEAPSQLVNTLQKEASSVFQSDSYIDTFHSRESMPVQLAVKSNSRSRLDRSMSRSRVDHLPSRETSLSRPVERKHSAITNVPNKVSLLSQDSVEHGDFSTPLQPREKLRSASTCPSNMDIVDIVISGNNNLTNTASSRLSQSNLTKFSSHMNLIESTSQPNLSRISSQSNAKKTSKNMLNSRRSPSHSNLPEDTIHSNLSRTPSQSSLLSTPEDPVSSSKHSLSRLSREDQTLMKNLKRNKSEFEQDNRSQIPTSLEDPLEDFQSIKLQKSPHQLSLQRSQQKKTDVPKISSKKIPSSYARDLRETSRSIRDVSEDRGSHVSSYSIERSSLREPSVSRNSEQRYGEKERSSGSISMREPSVDGDNNLNNDGRKKACKKICSSKLSTDERSSQNETPFEQNQIIREPSVDRRSEVSPITRISHSRETPIPRGLSSDKSRFSSVDKSSKSRDTREMSVDRSSKTRDTREMSVDRSSKTDTREMSVDRSSTTRDTREMSVDRSSKTRDTREMSVDRRSKTDTREMSVDRSSKTRDTREMSVDRCSTTRDTREMSVDRSSKMRDTREMSVDRSSTMSVDRSPKTRDTREMSVDRSSKTRDTREMSVDRSSKMRETSVDRSSTFSRSYIDTSSQVKKTFLDRNSKQQMQSLKAQPSASPSPRRQISDGKTNRAPSRQAKLPTSSQNIENLPNREADQPKDGGSKHDYDEERIPSSPKTDRATRNVTPAEVSIKSQTGDPNQKTLTKKHPNESNKISMDTTPTSRSSDKRNVRDSVVPKHEDHPIDDYEQQKHKAAFIENERKRLFARMQELERQIQSAKQGAQKQATKVSIEHVSQEGDIQGQKRNERNKKYVNRSSLPNVKKIQASHTQGSIKSDSLPSTPKPGLDSNKVKDSSAKQEVQRQNESKENNRDNREKNCDLESSGPGSNDLRLRDTRQLREMSSRTAPHEDLSSGGNSTQMEIEAQGENIKSEQTVINHQEQQLSSEFYTVKSEDQPASSHQLKAEPLELYPSAPSMKAEELDDEHSSGSRENYPGPLHISQYVSSQVVKQEQQAGSTSGGADGTPPLFIPGIFINSNEQFVVKSSTIYKKRAMSKKKRIKAKMKKMMENQQGGGGLGPQTQNPAPQQGTHSLKLDT